MNVAVIGPGSDVEEEELRLAYEVGRLAALEGWVVITGGLGGVMEAASRGAAETGGTVVGLLPGPDARDAGQGVMIPIPTGLGELRDGLVVRAADGVICVGGSWGTLSEVALAMRMGKPVIQLRGWSIADRSGQAIGGVIEADNPAEAVELLKRPPAL